MAHAGTMPLSLAYNLYFYSQHGLMKPVLAQSELAFRMMTRHYGAELCFTPMFDALAVRPWPTATAQHTCLSITLKYW